MYWRLAAHCANFLLASASVLGSSPGEGESAVCKVVPVPLHTPPSPFPAVFRVVPVPLYSPASLLTDVCVGPCRYRCIPQPGLSQPCVWGRAGTTAFHCQPPPSRVWSRASTTSSPRSPSPALRTSGEANGVFRSWAGTESNYKTHHFISGGMQF
jgi:hypothetical protein